jgi:3-dehydroquinate dehydratase/shikimate dehydrogenase
LDLMSGPQLCVTVAAPTMAELRRRRDAIVDADLVELRLDGVADPDVAGALAGRRHPVIVTCRPTWEGGSFAGSEEERRQLLAEALALGAEYVDVEWRAGYTDLIRSQRERVVLSSHDFTGVPGDLVERARAMHQTGAGVIKLAVTARCLGDCIPLLRLGAAYGRERRLALIAMGPHGVASRVLPQRFASTWSYAGSVNTVGQLTPETLVDLYNFRALGDATTVYGLVGSPIDHSVSPHMHNAAFRAIQLDAVYLPLPATDARDFVAFAQAIGLKGASVTIPFKVSLFDHVAEIVSVARRVGAINTIRVEADGRWLGGNTDVSGFLQPLIDRGIPLQGARAAVLGAGGSARAVAIALSAEGAGVTIHSRNAERAAETAQAVGVHAAEGLPQAGGWDLLVNCTPVGMHPHVDGTPLPTRALTGRYVYDLVYNPPRTRLLHEAAAAGCVTFGGLDMLVAQASEQFHWWTGVKPPPGVMRAAAERKLSEFIADEDHVV